ncbi:uncharacterized protein LOC144294885 isoform X2 [Canis aureus]
MTLVKKHLPAGEPWLCPVERAAQATGKKTDANLPSNHRDKAQNSNTEKGAIPNSQDRQGRLHTEVIQNGVATRQEHRLRKYAGMNASGNLFSSDAT